MSWIAGRCAGLIEDCIEVLERFGEVDYRSPSEVLGGSSVGMHYRHVLEFFGCLLRPESAQGSEFSICYDRRKRDLRIESELQYALTISRGLVTELLSGMAERPLELLIETDSEDPIRISTSLERELAYNLEHLVHHMALIRIGIKALQPEFSISQQFGLADSTRRHRNLSA
jgi:hypothetical protein